MGEVIMFPAPRPEQRASQAVSSQAVSQPAAPRSQPKEPEQAGHQRQLAGPEPLWRKVVGEQLRAERNDRGERIADVAERAGMSPQYLSEIERGRKDPSSEMLAAVAGALGLTLRELSRRVARRYDVIAVSPSVRPRGVQPTGPLCLAA